MKLNTVSALVQSSSSLRRKLKDLLQERNTDGVPKMMEKYKTYKNNYMKNMNFEPSIPGLSICMS